MTIELTLLGNRPYLEFPHNWIEWVGWLFLMILTLVWLWREVQQSLVNPRTKSKSSTRFTRAWWILLLVLIPLTGLYLVFRLPPGNVLTLPGTPADPQGPALVLLALLPITLAAGFLGALPAFIIGLLSGMVHALWETHSLFTPVVFCLLGVALSALFQQPYRTRLYRLLRKPLAAVATAAAVYPFLSLVLHSLVYPSSLANRLDYALSQLPADWQCMAGQLLVAGLFAQVIAWMFPSRWGSPDPSQPSPMERRLYIRFLFGMAPLVLLLLIALSASIWVISGRIANQMLKDQMSSTASAAADAIPYYLQTGQNLIRQISMDEPWLTGSPEQRNTKLQQELRLVPFFSQLFVLNTRLQTVAGYPLENYTDSSPSQDELNGITAALGGLPAQYYTIPPASQGENAQATFLTPLFNDQTGAVEGVLIGRSILELNPLIQPALSGLKNFAAQGGQSMLLDQNQRILYHTDRILILEPYTGPVAEQPSFFEDRSANGARRWVYFYPSSGSPWSVVLTLPARLVEQSAMTIAAPLYLVVLLLTLGRSTVWFADIVGESSAIISSKTLVYAIPLTAGAMMASIFFGVTVSLIFSLLLTLFAGMLFGKDFGWHQQRGL